MIGTSKMRCRGAGRGIEADFGPAGYGRIRPRPFLVLDKIESRARDQEFR